METPNLFRHACSELSQDAVLAYIMEWADPKFRESHHEMHTLGAQLVRAMVDRARTASTSSTNDPIQLKSLSVSMQVDGIDILVDINDSILLVIEDKVDSKEHSEQVSRYLQRAAERHNRTNQPWQEILALYVKTGNECRSSLPASAHGHFMRRDLLRVLNNAPETGNAIVDEFRLHLQRLESEATNYSTVPIHKWSCKTWEGFFMALEEWMYADRPHGASSDEWRLGWSYVPNQDGGFHGFWWHWRSLETHRCDLYLQIHSVARAGEIERPSLFIRVGGWEGKYATVDKKKLWQVWEMLLGMESTWRHQDLRLRKAGRFRSGKSANVAELVFGDNEESFLAMDALGILDMGGTQQRLAQAMAFLDQVRNRCGSSQLGK